MFVDANTKICCIGDSLTDTVWASAVGTELYKYRVDPSKHWTNVLTAKSGITLINKGIGGQTTSQMLARFTTDVVKQNPKYCTIWGGVNDVFQHNTTSTAANFKSMIDLCKNNGIVPILVACPTNYYNEPYKDQEIAGLKTLYDTVKQVSRENDIPLIELYKSNMLIAGNLNLDCYITIDKVHFTEVSHATVAAFMETSLDILTSPVRAANIKRLRMSLISELTRRNQTQASYTDPTLDTLLVKGLHIQEIS